MIYSRYTDKMPEKYKKYAIDFEENSTTIKKWDTNKFSILNTMIHLKRVTIPYLIENKMVTTNLKSDDFDMLETKNHDAFIYSYRGLNVLVHSDSYNYTFFVLYEPTKVDDLTSSFSRINYDYNNKRMFTEDFEDFANWYINSETRTNLSLEDFVEECRSMTGHRLICFNFSKTSDFKYRKIEFDDEYKKELANIIQTGGDITKIVNSIVDKNVDFVENYISESYPSEVMEDDVYQENCDIMLRKVLDNVLKLKDASDYIEEPTKYSLGGGLYNIEVDTFILPFSSEYMILSDGWASHILDVVSNMICINHNYSTEESSN